MEQRRQEILERVAEVESGDGVVLLTDMFGGTPSNLAISVHGPRQGRGDRRRQPADADQARRPCARPPSLQAAVAAAQEAGRKYINVASQLLADAQRG